MTNFFVEPDCAVAKLFNRLLVVAVWALKEVRLRGLQSIARIAVWMFAHHDGAVFLLPCALSEICYWLRRATAFGAYFALHNSLDGHSCVRCASRRNAGSDKLSGSVFGGFYFVFERLLEQPRPVSTMYIRVCDRSYSQSRSPSTRVCRRGGAVA